MYTYIYIHLYLYTYIYIMIYVVNMNTISCQLLEELPITFAVGGSRSGCRHAGAMGDQLVRLVHLKKDPLGKWNNIETNHGKSLLNHHLENILICLPSIQRANQRNGRMIVSPKPKWWFQIFVDFHPENWRRLEPILTCAYFSKGLKPSTRCFFLVPCLAFRRCIHIGGMKRCKSNFAGFAFQNALFGVGVL